MVLAIQIESDYLNICLTSVFNLIFSNSFYDQILILDQTSHFSSTCC